MHPPKYSICWPNELLRPAGKCLIKLHMYSTSQELPCTSLIHLLSVSGPGFMGYCCPHISYHILNVWIAKAMVGAL